MADTLSPPDGKSAEGVGGIEKRSPNLSSSKKYKPRCQCFQGDPLGSPDDATELERSDRTPTAAGFLARRADPIFRSIGGKEKMFKHSYLNILRQGALAAAVAVGGASCGSDDSDPMPTPSDPGVNPDPS